MQYQLEYLERKRRGTKVLPSCHATVRSRDSASGFERKAREPNGAPKDRANFHQLISVKEHKFGHQCSVVRRLHNAGRDC
jgi:hypothetical protein